MAKRPGWYKDPWGGQGKRWWDGQSWTEHYTDDQGVPAPLTPDVGVSMRRPLVSAEQVRPWWQAWWFIALILFACCWPLGVILIWTRNSTPTSIKVLATLGALVTNVMIGLVVIRLGLYAPPS